MKKLIIAVLALGLIGMFSATANADYVGGGFEASGSVMAGVGYQHFNSKVQTEIATNDQEASTSGVIGRYIPQPALGVAPAARQDNLEFFVDSVELDIMKSFGENIRLRADLDFGRFASGSNFGAFFLEQAYATANIPLGNGIEILFGRFNVPIGFESVDPVDNDTISKSILIRSGIRPTNSTGLKFYYAFSDLVDLHFYIVNQLTRDVYTFKANDIPSFGLRLGFNWGDPGMESTFGISGFAGLEHNASTKRNWTFAGDMDLNWWVTESFAWGMEGIFRKDNAISSLPVAGALNNMFTFGGLLNLKYLFSDVWDGTLKYAMAYQNKATNGTWDFIGGTGLIGKQTVHEISLAGNYAIADGAKLKLEGRFDIVDPTGGGNTEYVYGAALAFAYDF